MHVYSEEEARKILKKTLSYSKADEIVARLSQRDTGNIRYALNAVSTSGNTNERSLTVTSAYGKRTGTASTNEFDNASLEKTVRLSEELAKLSPENPEYMEMLPQPEFSESITYNPATAGVNAEKRATLILGSVKSARNNNLESAGYLENSLKSIAIMNSKGLFAYNRETDVSFSVTLRKHDGTGSGYSSKKYNDISQLDTHRLTETAAQKAKQSSGTKELAPGQYTVILEPLAVENMLTYFFQRFNAREADEGRSFLSKKGGGTRLGEQLFYNKLNIYSDPLHPGLPFPPFDTNGEPIKKTIWVENGVVKNLAYSRYWAQQKGKAPLPLTTNMIIEGGNQSLEQMIGNTEKGILVTRFYYIRLVDPQIVLLTGLTRDGTFYIENGRISYPVKNFRFNESPVTMLANIEEMGIAERSENMIVPPMKIRNFTFTSLSDAV